MSASYIIWRGPVVEDAGEAEFLLDEWHRKRDDSLFEPSEAIDAFAADLGKIADGQPCPELQCGHNDRMVFLNLASEADDAVLDRVFELAREHALVIYDPQGPEVYLPEEAARSTYSPPLGVGTYFKTFLMLLAAVGVFTLGWIMPVPLINWILMLVGGFFTLVILFLFWCYYEGSKPASA